MKKFFLSTYHLFDSIRWKLLVTYLLISLVPLFFIANSISTQTERFFTQNTETDLKSFASRVAGSINRADYFKDESTLPVWSATVRAYAKEVTRVLVVDERAVVIVDSGVAEAEVGKLFAAPEVLRALGKESVTNLRGASVTAAVAVLDDQSEVIGAVLVVSDMGAEWERLAQIRVELLRMAFLISGVIFVLVLFIAQWIVRPIRRARNAALRMTEGHFDQRLPVQGHDEFAELADAFNHMSERVSTIEAARQEFVSNVSHELKTPLSSIKVLSESLLFQDVVGEATYREFMQDINKEVNRMTDIVNELLILVRLDQVEHPLNIAPLKLNKLAADVSRRLFPLAERKNIKLYLDDVRQVNLDGDEIKLALALSNLIENAIKYTNEGGEIHVVIDCDHQNAFITVRDNGIGISEDDQQKVFARFYRADKARDRQTGGSGLGLAITHKTVLLHNGSIKLTSVEGEGSTFLVRVPLKHTEG